MAFADQASLAIDSLFRTKVRIAALFAAIAVVGETPKNRGETDAKRQRLGRDVLIDGCAAKLDAFAWAVAAFGTITALSTDSDIQFVVNSLWDDLSGVRSNE